MTFRRVQKGGEESYAFLSFFLPSEKTTQNVHQALGSGGVDACFYWFDNNWHYYRKWEHLINLTSLGKLPQAVYEQLPDYSQSDFSRSDHWVSRTISCLIKLGWNETEVRQRADSMVEIIQHIVRSE